MKVVEDSNVASVFNVLLQLHLGVGVISLHFRKGHVINRLAATTHITGFNPEKVCFQVRVIFKKEL
jgi:hypothetical protein